MQHIHHYRHALVDVEVTLVWACYIQCSMTCIKENMV